MNIYDFQLMKQNKQKITMITCYDYSSARIVENSNVDCLLVGDSVAMTVHGFETTISANITMMKLHTAAVRRGAKNKFIIADLPFLSYRQSLSKSVSAVQQIMQQGANAIKLEGVRGNEKLIRHLVESGIPVIGHLGLTPQLLHSLGGYKIQGRTEKSAKAIQEDALIMQELGCFMLVLECVPASLAKKITESLAIPIIGIGAGPDTDGQVLVFQDFLGLNLDFSPKFSKVFIQGADLFKSGINAYVKAVQTKEFPTDEHSF